MVWGGKGENAKNTNGCWKLRHFLSPPKMKRARVLDPVDNYADSYFAAAPAAKLTRAASEEVMACSAPGAQPFAALQPQPAPVQRAGSMEVSAPPAAALQQLQPMAALPLPRGLLPMQRWVLSLRSFPHASGDPALGALGVAVADQATGYILSLALHSARDVAAALAHLAAASAACPTAAAAAAGAAAAAAPALPCDPCTALTHLAFGEARAAAEAMALRAGSAAQAWPGQGLCLGDSPATASLWRAVSDTLCHMWGGAGAGGLAQRPPSSDSRWACGEGWVEVEAAAEAPASAPAAVPVEPVEDCMGGGCDSSSSPAPPVQLLSAALFAGPAASALAQALSRALPAPPPAISLPLSRLLVSANVRASIPGMAARTGSGSPQIALLGWLQGARERERARCSAGGSSSSGSGSRMGH